MDNAILYAEELAMAVRLKVSGRITPDVGNLLGLVIMEIVKMATKKLVMKEPSFISFAPVMFSPDVQSELVCLELRAIVSGKVDTSRPYSMIKFFETTAQNRLKNIRRNYMGRKMKGEILTESQLDISTTDSIAARVADINGKEIQNNTTRKVRQWERE